MAIKASGSSLAFSEIVSTWGGSTPHSLSEYYSAGDEVYSGAADEAGNVIPSSSTISFSDFYSTPTISTGSTTNVTSTSTVTVMIPYGVSTFTITMHGAGGQGGEGDESGAGGGGGGGGSGGTVVGTLTISGNTPADYNSSYSQQSFTCVAGTGGNHASSGSHANTSTAYAASGTDSFVYYNSVMTSAGGGGYGGGFSGNGTAYSNASQANNSIGSNFSASTDNDGTSADSYQGGSGDGFSSAGTAGKALASNPLSLTSTGGTAGATSSNAAATGGNASGYGAGGGGAASIDRTGAHHWSGGTGANGYVRTVIAS